jgi:hypothetical protein
MNHVLVVILLVCSGNAWAGNTPPDFNPAKWQQLVDKIIQKGAHMDTDDGAWRSLSSTVPADPTQAHLSNYISTIGGYDSSGTYVAEEISDVSENWQIDSNKNWNVDQWVLQISDAGELVQLAHNTLIETMDGQVLDDRALPVGAASDPAELAHWGKLLDAWYTVP